MRPPARSRPTAGPEPTQQPAQLSTDRMSTTSPWVPYPVSRPPCAVPSKAASSHPRGCGRGWATGCSRGTARRGRRPGQVEVAHRVGLPVLAAGQHPPLASPSGRPGRAAAWCPRTPATAVSTARRVSASSVAPGGERGPEAEVARRHDVPDQPAVPVADQVRVPDADRRHAGGRARRAGGVSRTCWPRVRSASESASVIRIGREVSKSPQVLVASSHRLPSRTRWQAWSPKTPGSSGRRKNRSPRCASPSVTGSSAHTEVCAVSKNPGPALVAVSSSRPSSRWYVVPSTWVARRRSRSPSWPKRPHRWVAGAARGAERAQPVLVTGVEVAGEVEPGARGPAVRAVGQRGDVGPGEREPEGADRCAGPGEGAVPWRSAPTSSRGERRTARPAHPRGEQDPAVAPGPGSWRASTTTSRAVRRTATGCPSTTRRLDRDVRRGGTAGGQVVLRRG